MRFGVDVFIFPSSASKREFTNVWSRLGIRPPNFDHSEIIPLGLQMELLDQGYKFPPELPETLTDYYLIVGRIDAEKNIRVTVTELDARLRNDSARIVVAGMPMGPKMAAIVGEIEALPRVITLPRFLEHKEVNALMRRARVVVIDYPVTNSGVATLAAAINANIFFADRQMMDDFASDYAYAGCYALRDDYGQMVEPLPVFPVSKPDTSPESRMSLAVIGERYAQMYYSICEKD